MKNSTRTTIYNILPGKVPVSEEEKLTAIREIEDEMTREQNAKAAKVGIPIINEEEFLLLVK